jgi:F0F1-type ATP synthase assembly protein I
MAKEGIVRKKVTFFGHEIVLTFVGSLILAFAMLLIRLAAPPLILTWLLATVFVWLGMLLFLYPIIRKIEDLM